MSWQAHDPKLITGFAAKLAEKHGWRLSACSPWKEGASNAIWSFDTDGGQFALKVGKLEYWRRLGIEAGVLGHLDGRDVPRLLDHGEAGSDLPWDWALLERVEGIHPFYLDEVDARRLGQLLVRVSQNTAGLELEDGGWKAYFEHRVLSGYEVAVKGMPEHLAGIFARRLDDIRQLERFGDLLDAQPPSIAHGDITPYNLIKKPDGQFCLIDWEHPRRAAAAWDLACVRKAFRLPVATFKVLRDTVQPKLPDEALVFADLLYQMQVCCWRAEMWYGRQRQDYGDFFLIEMGEELARAELLLRRLQEGRPAGLP